MFCEFSKTLLQKTHCEHKLLCLLHNAIKGIMSWDPGPATSIFLSGGGRLSRCHRIVREEEKTPHSPSHLTAQ